MVNKDRVEKLFKQIIFDELKLQETVPVQHLEDTPRRITKMLVDELFSGCFTEPPEITVFDNENPDDEHQVVCVKDVDIRSMCSHHFMPFYGKATICYIPKYKLAGLSKFARVAHYFAARPQVQEELTKQIVQYLNDKIEPYAVGAKLVCQHMCMVHRGAKTNGWMETRHIIAENEEVRKELKEILENS